MIAATVLFHAPAVPPRLQRVRRAHEIVNEASIELRLDDGSGGEAVTFLAMAVATHLRCSLGDVDGRAAMKRATDHAFGPEDV